MKLFNLLALLMLAVPAAHAESVFVSKAEKVTTVELFTSEGCSSCPPAETWLARFKDDDALWQDIIPLAFHVDYWDYLGWRDRYASPAHSARQRQYAEDGNLARVYTPGIVVAGNEYRKFFNPLMRNSPVPLATGQPGPLTLSLDTNEASVNFASEEPLTAHIVWLGMNESRKIRRGENAGRTLTHQFVVLEHHSLEGKGTWRFADLEKPENADAVVAWVSTDSNQAPLQAVGGPL